MKIEEKKIIKSFIVIILSFLLAGIVFIISGAIETNINEKRDTSSSFGFAATIFMIMCYFLLKKVWRKKKTKKIKKTDTSPEVKSTFIESFDLVVTGSNFNTKNDVPREVYIDDLEEYDTLTLQVEPDNKHDLNAVLVLHDGVDIGYIPKRYSEKITTYINGNYNIWASVKKIHKKDGKKLCIAIIEITKTESS